MYFRSLAFVGLIGLTGCVSAVTKQCSELTGTCFEVFRDVATPLDSLAIGTAFYDKEGKIIATRSHVLPAPALAPITAAIQGGFIYAAAKAVSNNVSTNVSQSQAQDQRGGAVSQNVQTGDVLQTVTQSNVDTSKVVINPPAQDINLTVPLDIGVNNFPTAFPGSEH